MTTKPVALGLLFFLLLVGGCYKRTPLQTTTPAPATRIVATLTDSGTVAMGSALGSGALEVEGVISAADETQWTLELLRVDHRDQRSIAWNHERVTFPRSTLTNPLAVVLDKPKSWLTGAGIVIGAYALARAFDLFGADEADNRPPPPPASVVPVIRNGGSE